MRRLVWAVGSAFVLGALIAFAVSLLRRPSPSDPSGYLAPVPGGSPFAS
jgi:hypothetical protein